MCVEIRRQGMAVGDVGMVRRVAYPGQTQTSQSRPQLETSFDFYKLFFSNFFSTSDRNETITFT